MTEGGWTTCADHGTGYHTLEGCPVCALVAERDALRARVDRGLKWCDMMDGPVSKSEFVNGQATAAQQIRAALSPAASAKPE